MSVRFNSSKFFLSAPKYIRQDKYATINQILITSFPFGKKVSYNCFNKMPVPL